MTTSEMIEKIISKQVELLEARSTAGATLPLEDVERLRVMTAVLTEVLKPTKNTRPRLSRPGARISDLDIDAYATEDKET